MGVRWLWISVNEPPTEPRNILEYGDTIRNDAIIAIFNILKDESKVGPLPHCRREGCRFPAS